MNLKQYHLCVFLAVWTASFALISSPIAAHADSFVVNSTGDTEDDDSGGSFDGTCDTGSLVDSNPECTLRAAIQEANAATGPHMISFAIPSSDGNCSVSDICTISPASIYPDIVQEVVLDGSTQPGNAAVCTASIPDRPAYKIVLEGDPSFLALRLESGSDGSIIRGLNIRNFFDGIAIISSDNNHVQCSFLGTDETGMLDMGQAQNGVVVGGGATGNIIGGATSADGNLISGNNGDGVRFFGGFTGGGAEINSVLGNFIGTQKTGIAPLGNAFSGISFFGGTELDGNFVGLMPDGGSGFEYNGNILGANGSGIFIETDVSDTIVAGNWIGTDQSGTADVGNTFAGVELYGAKDNRIGGSASEDVNVIAHNDEAGVAVLGSGASGNTISRNSFFDNNEIAIDLATNEANPNSTLDGRTPNDNDDTDTGPHGLLNTPVISEAGINNTTLTVKYAISTDIAAASYPITAEFYIVDAAGKEGKTYIGSNTSSVPGNTNVSFPNTSVQESDFIIALAIDADMNTSEFSESVEVLNDDCPADDSKLAPGVCGCGVPDVDSDNDSFLDCNDACINDPAKSSPGSCGCGVSDIDSDGDETPDCNDACENDSQKIVAGSCGCGVAESDTDGDGVPDCNDSCPADPEKTEAGVCGCGVADSDLDENGILDCLPNDVVRDSTRDIVNIIKDLRFKNGEFDIEAALQTIQEQLASFDTKVTTRFSRMRRILNRISRLKDASRKGAKRRQKFRRLKRNVRKAARRLLKALRRNQSSG